MDKPSQVCSGSSGTMEEAHLNPVSVITVTTPVPGKLPSLMQTPDSRDSAIMLCDPSITGNKMANNAIRRQKLKKALAFVALQTGLFLSSLDSTIVSTCLPRIGSDFQEFTIAAWVANSYILTYDSFQPLFSKLNDIFGRKWTMITGLSILIFGSLLCGVANSMIMLIVCRAIAGIGSAAVLSAVSVITFEMAPLEKRGNYQGIMNSVNAFAAVVGPLIGGGFTDGLTWRWCFYINLPIGGLCIAILIFFLDLPVPDTNFIAKLKRVDYVGTFLTLILSILFLLALNFGGQIYPWGSPMVLVPLILSFALVGALALYEYKWAWDPILPPHLIMNRSIFAVLCVNWWSGVTFFVLVYYLPLYFQVVFGDSAMWSGIRLIPMQVFVCVGSTSAGYVISKFKNYRPFLWIGCFSLTVCFGLVSLFGVGTDFGEIYGITIIAGLTSGFIFSSTILSLQASSKPQDISVVTGLGDFARLLGSAVGIAIASTVLNSRLSQNLPAVVPPEYVEMITKSSHFVRNGLPEQYQPAVFLVYADALRWIWYIMVPITGISFFASVFVENYDLYKPGKKLSTMGSNEETKEMPSRRPWIEKVQGWCPKFKSTTSL